MKLSYNGYNFIEKFEGVRTKAYKDSAGIWTIGIGFIQINGVPVVENQEMELDEIQEEFFKQIVFYENKVNELVTTSLNQNQFDALVSFCYNLGPGNLKTSTLLKKVNKNPNDPTIKDEFLKGNKSAGKVIAGLTRRRREEAALYFA